MGTELGSAAMADSCLLAAIFLIDSWEGRKEPRMIRYPLLYLCRHALEVYLKDALYLRRKSGHTDIPARLRKNLYAWRSIDPDGQIFRYVTTVGGFQLSVPGGY